MRVGALQLTDLPIGFADIRLFAELGLDDTPALLLGMDALRLFPQVSIDFRTRRLLVVPARRGA